jgi:type I restriction enzyme S subunit
VKSVVILMNHEPLRRKVIREATGTTVKHTSPDRTRSGFALKPTPDEQYQIVSRLTGMDNSIATPKKELAKLYSLKSGLQDALLTGRVHVPETIMEGAERA